MTEAKVMEFIFFFLLFLFLVNDLCTCINTYFTSNYVTVKIVDIVIRHIIYIIFIFISICALMGLQIWLADMECVEFDLNTYGLVFATVASGSFVVLMWAFYHIIKMASLPQEVRRDRHAARNAAILRRLDTVHTIMCLMIFFLFGTWFFLAVVLNLGLFPEAIHLMCKVILKSIFTCAW